MSAADRTSSAATASPHPWDSVRSMPVTIDRMHESLYRSYQILREVKAMLDRDDSPQTVRAFIEWAEDRQYAVETTTGVS